MVIKKILFMFATQSKENVQFNYYFFYYYYWCDFTVREGIILNKSKRYILSSLPRNQEAFFYAQTIKKKNKMNLYTNNIIINSPP
ncbi:Uncharacterised protein [Weeksella virosa]|uniref:Uncharacterized protein n=1 Tax=Weeksella virosa (strain ATCC 43766 / DSM 16922 / JCM 21250 / CCUG 30538 / CDC 9751 / IAM 14551 / NBRC 16016 / NCTC 11634 / CL345/78) TaxID=865938 RepID=F0P2Q5_WEEVC|nr:hypothetical protein Weevi_0069 [Weeksella virosa DSM 16922]VEH63481.1 Uncharacterised protein [Weeksella virosa]